MTLDGRMVAVVGPLVAHPVRSLVRCVDLVSNDWIRVPERRPGRDRVHVQLLLTHSVVSALPKAELFADMITSLAETNEQVRGFDITRLIDGSFVESAVSRGLDT